METEFEDAESLGYDLGDFDSLVDLPEVLQAYYEAPDSFPSGEMAEALQRQQSQQHQQEPSADGAAHGCVAEGADAAVAEADGAAAGERSAGGTPHSHTLQDDNITDQLDKVGRGACQQGITGVPPAHVTHPPVPHQPTNPAALLWTRVEGRIKGWERKQLHPAGADCSAACAAAAAAAAAAATSIISAAAPARAAAAVLLLLHVLRRLFCSSCMCCYCCSSFRCVMPA
eukprot:365917-Chlamydomonas_euryale.AAC.23